MKCQGKSSRCPALQADANRIGDILSDVEHTGHRGAFLSSVHLKRIEFLDAFSLPAEVVFWEVYGTDECFSCIDF